MDTKACRSISVVSALLLMRSLLRDVEALRCGAGEELLFNRDLVGRLGSVARGSLGVRAAELASFCGETILSLRGNANKSLAMDVLAEAASGRIETDAVAG